jgi:hypothetical protein
MSMAIVAAGVGAAGAIGGAYISSQASKGAAQTQADSASQASQAQLQASEESIAAQQQASEAAQANQQPWINAGSAALTQLGNLLGIQIAPSGQYAAAATSQGSGSGGNGGSGTSLFSVDPTGRIIPNQSLYSSNPQYKQAYDNLTALNKSKGFDPNPFSSAQANQIVTQQMTQQLQAIGVDPNTITNPGSTAANGQFQPGTVYGGATGGSAGSTGQADPSSFGAQSKQRVSDLMGFNGADPTAALQATPGYQWALQQGLQGVENSGAARGMQLSGATLKDLNNYAQGAASQTYQTQLGNAESVYNSNVGNLMQMAGLGSGAAGTASGNTVATGANIGNTLTATGGQIGSNMIGAGNAQAAGQVGSANAYTGAFNNISQMYTMNSLFGGGGGGGSSVGVPGWTPPGS